MNSQELIERLVVITTTSPGHYIYTGILLSSLEDARIFHNEFERVLKEVPEMWLPRFIERNTIREIEYNTNKIYFFNNPSWGRGHSLSMAYIDNNLPTKLKDEYYKIMWPCVYPRKIMEFENR